jgi:hypothetical protein
MKGSPKRGHKYHGEIKRKKPFQALKKAVTLEPVLKHIQIGKPVTIDPDSSQYTIGAVCLQRFLNPDGTESLHSVAYLSKKLSKTEQRYSS